MRFEANRLGLGEWLTGVCGVLLFADMLVGWYDAGPANVNAWEAFGVLDVYLLVVIALALALVAATATQRAPAVPMVVAVVLTPLAALATVLVVVRVLAVPDLGADAVSVSAGAIVGLVLVAGVAAGGTLAQRAEGTTSDHARAQTEELLAADPQDTSRPPLS